MKLDKNKNSLQTCMGSLLTMLVYIVVGAYAYQKIDVWVNKKDVEIMSSILMSEFDEEEKFSFDDGFNVALALASYGGDDGKSGFDKSLGEIVFRAYEWG